MGRKATAKSSTADLDPYWTAVEHQWSAIVRLYGLYADKRPVMLFDIQEQRVYAFPFEDFRAELSDRSQASLTRQYERALADGAIVIFVRDNEQEKLVSYSRLLCADAEVRPPSPSVRWRSQRVEELPADLAFHRAPSPAKRCQPGLDRCPGRHRSPVFHRGPRPTCGRNCA